MPTPHLQLSSTHPHPQPHPQPPRPVLPGRRPSSIATASTGASSSSSFVSALQFFSSSPSSPAPSSSHRLSILFHDKKDHYLPGSGISGNILITPTKDTEFSCLIVTLEGTARTWNDRAGVGNRINIRNTFLKMACPIDEEDYPSLRIFRAHTTYSFYFSFVLPETLLETECDHLACHRLLPSSLGEGTSFSHDDCSPDMARITYQIHAKVIHLKPPDSRRTVPLQASAPFNVVAAYKPDINNIPHHHFRDQEVSQHSSDSFTRFYRTTKILKKGLLIKKSMAGKITLEASILQPFIFGQPDSSVPMLLTLSCSPGDNPQSLPKVESATVRLRAYTYFSTVSMTYLPVPDSRAVDPRLGIYHETFSINSTAFPTPPSSTPCAQWSKESANHHTFSTTLQLRLPRFRTLVPNFWSCLIGRQYEAEVTVKLSAGYGSISLKIPVEITTSDVADMLLNSELLTSSPALQPRRSSSSSDSSDTASDDDDDDVLNVFTHWSQPPVRRRDSNHPTMYDIHHSELRNARHLAAYASINDLATSAARLCQDLSPSVAIPMYRHHSYNPQREEEREAMLGDAQVVA
ncbi:hypothetical protein BZA70DRAFT_275524 [Myxozyma melibiosi]|uniref:Bul1 C-terminal domain-containing protein n=1 Tax=Myxozyma melibiosi TaxID=54550 RepID=A0ABR1F855_9ASCO